MVRSSSYRRKFAGSTNLTGMGATARRALCVPPNFRVSVVDQTKTKVDEGLGVLATQPTAPPEMGYTAQRVPTRRLVQRPPPLSSILPT